VTDCPSPPSVSWQRTLWVIWFAEFTAIIGFSSVLPILPFYVQKLGVTSPDAVKFWTGMIFSAHAVTMAVMAPIWGSLADRYGRKPMVERAMFGGAVVIGLMSLARTAPQLTALRAFQGMLTGTVAAATTLVVSVAPRERVGYALGLLQMAVYTGHSVGPLLGGFIADQLGFRATFWITSGLLLCGGLTVTLLVRENFTPPPRSASSPGRALLQNFRVVFSSPPLISVLGVRFMMRLAARVLAPMLPLLIQSLAPTGAAATLSGLVRGSTPQQGQQGPSSWAASATAGGSAGSSCSARSVPPPSTSLNTSFRAFRCWRFSRPAPAS
jgi:DHA1 family multidrug resistance protein-like MFS transporter